MTTTVVRHIGITGTREGGTAMQLRRLRIAFANLDPDATYVLHHGDCIGIDEQVADIAHDLGWDLVGHPPTIDKYRAFHADTYHWHPPRPYHDRNHNIVDVSELMFAAPKAGPEYLRSGTWATVRYARANGSQLWIATAGGSLINGYGDTAPRPFPPRG